jgi:hypothetical protein
LAGNLGDCQYSKLRETLLDFCSFLTLSMLNNLVMLSTANPASGSQIKDQRGFADDEKPAIEAQFEIVEDGKHPGGRPTKLTQARFKQILGNIASGITIMRAVIMEGVTYQCWRKHLQQKPDWQMLCDEAMEEHLQRWRAEALESVRAAFPKSWQAAMTYLERRHADEFCVRFLGRRESKEPHDVGVNVNAAACAAITATRSPEQVRAELIDLQRAIQEEANRSSPD